MAQVALVVDDSMLIRHTVCRFLEERGFVVESGTNGAEALEMLATILPDIIITDLQMPRMTGSELITALKLRQATAPIPVVVLAGKQSAGSPGETRASFVIYKDIEIQEQLQKALSAALGEATPV